MLTLKFSTNLQDIQLQFILLHHQLFNAQYIHRRVVEWKEGRLVKVPWKRSDTHSISVGNVIVRLVFGIGNKSKRI